MQAHLFEIRFWNLCKQKYYDFPTFKLLDFELVAVLFTMFLAVLMTAQAKAEIHFTWAGIWQRYRDLTNFVRTVVRRL